MILNWYDCWQLNLKPIGSECCLRKNAHCCMWNGDNCLTPNDENASLLWKNEQIVRGSVLRNLIVANIPRTWNKRFLGRITADLIDLHSLFISLSLSLLNPPIHSPQISPATIWRSRRWGHCSPWSSEGGWTGWSARQTRDRPPAPSCTGDSHTGPCRTGGRHTWRSRARGPRKCSWTGTWWT